MAVSCHCNNFTNAFFFLRLAGTIPTELGLLSGLRDLTLIHNSDLRGTIPKELWTEVGALGFGGLYVSEESGGAGLSRLDATLVFEALAMACPSVGSFLSIHNMCGGMIDKFGTPEQKAKWLPDLVSLSTVFSYCLTEPGSGSDASALRTRAKRTNEGFDLNGTKAFISGGGYSDAYVCMVRTGDDGPKGISAMVVEDGAQATRDAVEGRGLVVGGDCYGGMGWWAIGGVV